MGWFAVEQGCRPGKHQARRASARGRVRAFRPPGPAPFGLASRSAGPPSQAGRLDTSHQAENPARTMHANQATALDRPIGFSNRWMTARLRRPLPVLGLRRFWSARLVSTFSSALRMELNARPPGCCLRRCPGCQRLFAPCKGRSSWRSRPHRPPQGRIFPGWI